MTPEQIQQLLALLTKIAEGLTTNRPYTLTGASDWPLLVIFVGLIIGMIGFMWRDLRASMTSQNAEMKESNAAIGGVKDRLQAQETTCRIQTAHCPATTDRRHPVHGRRSEDAEDGSGV